MSRQDGLTLGIWAQWQDGTIKRNKSMVRNAIFRANEEIQMFQAYYL